MIYLIDVKGELEGDYEVLGKASLYEEKTKGQWEEEMDCEGKKVWYVCSVCGFEDGWHDWKFCPNCGSIMKGGADTRKGKGNE